MYQCGTRTSRTWLASSSDRETTPTHPHHPHHHHHHRHDEHHNTTDGSTGFRSPSPIAQDPSLHSLWLPPSKPRTANSKIAEPVSRRPSGKGACTSPLFSPSLDANSATGSSGELTQENATVTTRCLTLSHGGASLSQEAAERSNNATLLGGQPLTDGKGEASTREHEGEHSDPLRCSSLCVVPAAVASKHSAAEGSSSPSRTASGGKLSCVMPTKDKEAGSEAPHESNDSSKTCPSGKPSYRPMNSMEGRALFVGDATPSSSLASSVASVVDRSLPHATEVIPSFHQRKDSDERTPIKQSLSQIRSAAGVAAGGATPLEQGGVDPLHAPRGIPPQRGVAVAFTPDSVWKNGAANTQESASAHPVVASSVSVPAAEANRPPPDSGTGPTCAGRPGRPPAEEVLGNSPQRLPSYLATPNPCVFEGGGGGGSSVSPDGGTDRRMRSRSRSTVNGVKDTPCGLDEPDGTPVSRFTGFPSPVKLSPIPIKGNQGADAFAVHQAAVPRRGGALQRSTRRSAEPEGAAPPVSDPKSDSESEERRLADDGFLPEYIPSSSSNLTSERSSLRSSTRAFLPSALPEAPPHPLAACAASEDNYPSRVDGTGASTSHLLTLADTTQPPAEEAHASHAISAVWSEVTGDKDSSGNNGSGQLSPLRSTSEPVFTTDGLPSWTTRVAGQSRHSSAIIHGGSAEVGRDSVRVAADDNNNGGRAAAASLRPPTATAATKLAKDPREEEADEPRSGNGGEQVRRSGCPAAAPLEERACSDARGSRSRFSVLPIPGRNGVGAGGNAVTAVPEAAVSHHGRPRGRRQSSEHSSTPLSSSAKGDKCFVDAMSSPSKLYRDYYYPSSLANQRRTSQRHPSWGERPAVSSCERVFSLGAAEGKSADMRPPSHGRRSPDDLGDLLRPRRLHPGSSSSTFFEAISSIESTQATYPPRVQAVDPERGSCPSSPGVPASQPGQAAEANRAPRPEKLPEREAAGSQQRPQSQPPPPPPHRSRRAALALFKTEARAAVQQPSRRFATTADHYMEKLWTDPLSGRYAIDTFL